MNMPHLVPSAVRIFDPPQDEQDLRLRHLFRPETIAGGDAILLGVPSDLGVIAGGGRGGARLGPEAFREEVRRYGCAYHFERGIDLTPLNVEDAGNLQVDAASLDLVHRRLTETIASAVRQGKLPVVIGGGHDLTFAAVRGLLEAFGGPLGGLTVDAHFDVREIIDGTVTSGTPFRRILEELDLPGERFVEIGGNGCVNAKKHLDYLMAKKAQIFSLSEVRQKGISPIFSRSLQIAGHRADRIFVSIDLDGVAQAFAPGVSAPSPDGLTPEEITQAAFLAGLDPKVGYLDIMELNPVFDQDGRTARLAVAILHAFLCGLAARRENRHRKSIGFTS